MDKKKINISLVGGQPFPVYAQILDNQPDIAILIHSKETKRDAERIKEVLKKNLPLTGTSLLEISANDNAQANRDIMAQSTVYCKPENKITINIAGGTKPWSLLFAKHFGGKVQLVYIDQNNIIWDMDTLEHHELPWGVSLDDLLALYGAKIKSQSNLGDLSTDDIAVLPKIERAWLWNKAEFRELTSSDDEEEHNMGNYELRLYHFKNRKPKTFTFASPHIDELLFNYRWFEVMVGQFVSQWPQAKRVWLNTEVALPTQEEAINELDVIVETKTGKFLFIECKTKVSKPTDIDKFSEVVRKTGGTGVKRIFMTYNPMSEDLAAKCEQTRIPHYDMRAITSSPSSQNAFFGELDTYMSRINER